MRSATRDRCYRLQLTVVVKCLVAIAEGVLVSSTVNQTCDWLDYFCKETPLWSIGSDAVSKMDTLRYSSVKILSGYCIYLSCRPHYLLLRTPSSVAFICRLLIGAAANRELPATK